MYFNFFLGANFIQPTLHEDKPDTVLIHIGSNNIIPSKQHNLNVKDVIERIIDIGYIAGNAVSKI